MCVCRRRRGDERGGGVGRRKHMHSCICLMIVGLKRHLYLLFVNPNMTDRLDSVKLSIGPY